MEKVGKPLKYKTPKELSKLIVDYFEKTPKDERTVTWLALVIWSKQLLNDYEKRIGYKDMVTEAKLMVENAYEKSLRKNGRAWDIFALKNFWRKDKSEVVQETTATIKLEQVQALSDEDLLALTK